jgi:ribosomal protein S18 acetylase RimI-like enzyme
MHETDHVRLPVAGPTGIDWRPPITDDVPAIVILHDVCCDADDTHRAAPSEILDFWESKGITPSTDALVGFADDGELVATIWSIVSPGAETKRRAFGHENRIHPEYRTDAVRDFALGWWEARSRQRFAEHDDELPRLLYQYVYQHEVAEIEYYESRGYEIVRYFHELGRDLLDPLDPVVLPDEIDVRPMETNRGDALTVRNAAFRDHWGGQPVSSEQWPEFFTGAYLPGVSYVAYDGGIPVAYLIAARFPHDFEDRGWPHFWIEGIGTVRSHRRRGIATGLIATAMEAMKKDGMEYAILDVDAENSTGAYSVYEDLGFRQLRAEVALEKNA